MTRLAAAIVALALLLTGCQVRVSTGVDTHRDGSGVVRVGVGLDKEALDSVPDLPHKLRVDDLRAAGWVVTGPATEKDGLSWVRAEKRFRTPSEAGRAVAEINGPNGPFRDFQIRRSHSLLRTTTHFRGVVDLSSGANGFVDPTLQQKLGGEDLGLDTATLQRRLGVVLNRIFRVQVVAQLPGSVASNAPSHAQGGVVWAPAVGERATLVASAHAWNVAVVLYGLVALVLAAAAVGVFVVGRS